MYVEEEKDVYVKKRQTTCINHTFGIPTESMLCCRASTTASMCSAAMPICLSLCRST